MLRDNLEEAVDNGNFINLLQTKASELGVGSYLLSSISSLSIDETYEVFNPSVGTGVYYGSDGDDDDDDSFDGDDDDDDSFDVVDYGSDGDDDDDDSFDVVEFISTPIF